MDRSPLEQESTRHSECVKQVGVNAEKWLHKRQGLWGLSQEPPGPCGDPQKQGASSTSRGRGGGGCPGVSLVRRPCSHTALSPLGRRGPPAAPASGAGLRESGVPLAHSVVSTTDPGGGAQAKRQRKRDREQWGLPWGGRATGKKNTGQGTDSPGLEPRL